MVHSHFSQGILCKFDLYMGKTVKSLKLDPSMLKLTGNRKTGPDLKIINISFVGFLFFFLSQHFIPHLCVYCVFVRDDESGSQNLSLKETSSPCVTTVQRKQTNPIQSLPPLITSSSSTQHRCTLYGLLASSPSILFL